MGVRMEQRVYIHRQNRLQCVELAWGIFRNNTLLLGAPHCVRFLMCTEGQGASSWSQMSHSTVEERWRGTCIRLSIPQRTSQGHRVIFLREWSGNGGFMMGWWSRNPEFSGIPESYLCKEFDPKSLTYCSPLLV